ncbi:glycosyltransferase [Pedobacter deserti]|uniref:glycosyltransferase n=1 Tax=Pedobacter deserti TaxID=2817382 RepID=UPI002109AD1D|nr:glycosyltransferase [Pedobacter sp. SYSU D00382]
MNFVFVSLQRINTDRESTSTSLAKELAKHHKVLYVNPPIDRRTWLNPSREDQYGQAHIQAIKEAVPALRACTENLWEFNPPHIIESINWIPSTLLFTCLNYFNNKTFASDIKKAIKEIGFSSFVLINDKDMFRSYYLKEILKPRFYIYLDRDYTLGFDYWRKHGISLEPKLMAKSDAVVCNSPDFQKRASQYNPNSFYIGNGSGMKDDVEDKAGRRPKELADITGPVIGYVGALTSHRLDISLIEEVASYFTSSTIVLVGPQDDVFQSSKLHQMPNVLFIEKKSKEEVPSYISCFDVCINPQLKNEITMGNFPMKIVEYLAMGKPVVATKTNTMEEIFSSCTYLADNAKEFISQTERALSENTDIHTLQRKAFSRQFSWTNVTSALLNVISNLDGNEH